MTPLLRHGQDLSLHVVWGIRLTLWQHEGVRRLVTCCHKFRERRAAGGARGIKLSIRL